MSISPQARRELNEVRWANVPEAGEIDVEGYAGVRLWSRKRRGN
jgi:hypothetical protein